MTSPDVGARDSTPTDGRPIQRLLFVSDAAVADVDELPRAVRAVIDDAAELYVVTPSLPGRLAWLAPSSIRRDMPPTSVSTPSSATCVRSAPGPAGQPAMTAS